MEDYKKHVEGEAHSSFKEWAKEHDAVWFSVPLVSVPS
jgi:hypothetical protein